MTFMLEDYVKHVSDGKIIAVFHIRELRLLKVINSHPEMFEQATREEYEEYWGFSNV